MRRLMLIGAAACALAILPTLPAAAMPFKSFDPAVTRGDSDTMLVRYDRGHHYGWRRGHHYGWFPSHHHHRHVWMPRHHYHHAWRQYFPEAATIGGLVSIGS